MSQKWAKRILIIYIIFALSYLVFGELLRPADDLGADPVAQEYSQPWYRLLENGERVPQSVPGKCPVKRGSEIRLVTKLPDDLSETTYLCFRGVSQNLAFYVDGDLRREYNTKKTRIMGQYSTAAYIFVKIYPKDAGKELTFVCQSGSPYSGIFYTVYQGSQLSVWKYYLRQYVSELFVAFLVLALSVIIIIASYILQRYYKKKIDFVYLGWGMFLASLWELTNSVFRQLLFPNVAVPGDMAFFMVMLMPLPFIIYINSLQKGRFERLYRILSLVVIVQFPLCIFLHASRRADFNYTIRLMALTCMVSIISFVVTVLIDVVRGDVKDYRIVAWGMLGAFVAATVQLLTYFRRTAIFNGIILSVGLLILMGFATVNTIQTIAMTERDRQNALTASRFKGEFLANMSHEIRTPVNAVLGLGEMILRDSREARIREYALDIGNVGHTLLSLINDILDLSKIESGKMGIVLIDYDFSSLIVDVANMMTMKGEDKGLDMVWKIDESLPCGLYGDDVRLKQILLNLLNNAVKYTDTGSVTLEISGQQTEEPGQLLLHFKIQDTGIGIKDEDKAKLFEAFERIEESRNREIEGTGLGMSITVKLLALMGTRLQVDSVYGQGTVFSFDLMQRVTNPEPLGNLQARMAERLDAGASDTGLVAEDVTVLLVDDNFMNRKVFKGLLNKTNLKIIEAENGTAALEKIAAQRYDMIFLDHMMPDINGIEVLQRSRQMENNPNQDVPVIALTANAIAGVKTMYLEAGFTDYLSKPVNADQLEHMLEKYLPRDKWHLEKLPDQTIEESFGGTDVSGEEALPLVEGIDWAYVLRKMKDPSLAENVARDFCFLARGDLEELEGYYGQLESLEEPVRQLEASEEPMRQFRVKVHAMKTSAAMTGALEVSYLARLLEYAARAEDWDRIRGLFSTFAQEWTDLRDRLEEGLASLRDPAGAASAHRQTDGRSGTSLADMDAGGLQESAGKSARPQMDQADLHQKLDRLKSAMEEMDIDTADAIMSELSTYQLHPDEIRLRQQLGAAVRSLDEARVIELADQWLGLG